MGTINEVEYFRGIRVPIAVDAWFTAKGEIIIRFFKWEDSEGRIKTVKQIEIIRREEIQSHINLKCRVAADGIEKIVKITFLKKECIWFLYL